MPTKLPFIARHTTAAGSLAEYFERRLCADQEVIRHEPLGYRSLYDRKSDHPVLCHEETGTLVCCHCVDLVERISRNAPPASTKVVFVYPPREFFNKLVHFTQRDPLAAWEFLTGINQKEGVTGFLQRVEEPRASVKGTRAASKLMKAGVKWNKDRASWYGWASSREPHDHARSRSDNPSLSQELLLRTTYGGQGDPLLCVALFIPAKVCRAALHSTEPGALELSHPNGELLDVPVRPMLEKDKDEELIDAAMRRDLKEVKELLEEGANPNYQNARGWSALHAACSVRPHFELLEVLAKVTNPMLRTKKGKLCCDHSDSANHVDAACLIRRVMLDHPEAKHMSEAQALSKHAVVNVASNQGKRRDDDEALDLMQDFCVMMMAKYGSSAVAFKAFDINANGTLSVAEFYQYANQMRFPGDATALFKALDVQRVGQIAPEEFGKLEKLYYHMFPDDKEI